MRAVVEVDEDAKGRTILVVSELPYQVNPDNLAESIADLVRDGKVGGIADVRTRARSASASASSSCSSATRSPRSC
jgi:DNA gyrase subunit A